MARDVSVCEILQTEIRMLHASRTKADLSMYQLENAFWEVIACTWMAVLLGSGRGGEGRGWGWGWLCIDGVYPPTESLDGRGERVQVFQGLGRQSPNLFRWPHADWGHGRKESAEVVLPSPKAPQGG